MKNYKLQALTLLILVTILSMSAKAQLGPLGATYYQNEYLSNPAFAGFNKKIKLNMHYRNQWSAIPGAPVNFALTGSYQLKDTKSGVGLNAYLDQAGLLNRTRVVGSYAYHLPLSGNGNALNFGVSVGFMSERLSKDILSGDPNDPNIANFNGQPTYIDGDFGVAYTSNQLTLQAAIPNLNLFLKRDKNNSIDLGTYYGAIAYKIFEDQSSKGYNIEPKVAYRGVKGFKSIIDAGVKLDVGMNSNLIDAMFVYHSSKSVTVGIGMLMRSKLDIQAMYNSQAGGLSSYTNGAFEIGLGLNL